MRWLYPLWLIRITGKTTNFVIAFPMMGLSVVFLIGILFWGGFNWSLELTNTEAFCVSCHEMRQFVFKDYQKSIHYSNRTGVRATCPDCHVPRQWIHKVIRKVKATNELFHWITGTIDTAEKFEAKRAKLAGTVWAVMKRTDSRECRDCHRNDFMNGESQSNTAAKLHALAVPWKMTCIECHQGITHKLPASFDKEVVIDQIHDRLEKEKIECSICHEDIAAPSKDDKWD